MDNNKDNINKLDFDFFKTQIDKSCIDYMAMLPDGSDIRNTFTFNGMILYAGNSVFAPYKTCDFDIDLLNSIFNYYVSVCSLYNKQPFVLQFCLFVHIDDNTYSRWLNGEERASPHRMGICQIWRRTCEQSQVSATDVKSMFLLKSKYGYVEATAPQVITHEIRQETGNLIEKYKDLPKFH